MQNESKTIFTEERAWHAMPHANVMTHINTSVESGLSANTVKKRLSVYGKNELPAKKSLTLKQIFIKQFLNPLIYILFGAGLLSLLVGDVSDALFILAIVVINAVIGTWQEWQAEQSAQSLKKLLYHTARVRRDGVETDVPTEEIVPGDILILSSGDKIAADARLIKTANITVDESMLTGESTTVPKDANTSVEKTAQIADRKTMVFAGTVIATGRATAVVVETGLHTQLGVIASSIATQESGKTPLIKRMESFAKQVSYIIVTASILLGLITVAQGSNIVEMFFLMIALAVAAIPENLPVALTVTLSIASHRMSKRNVIVRTLTSVESLGSCSYIASDKTGTLTVNQQTAQIIFTAAGDTYFISGEGYDGNGSIRSGGNNKPETDVLLNTLVMTGIHNNESSLEIKDRVWTHTGDPVDVALLALGYKYGKEPMHIKRASDTVFEIPYESQNKYAATISLFHNEAIVSAKGALGTILEKCSASDETIQRVEARAERLSANGYRVLALAGKKIHAAKDEYSENDISELELYGVVGLMDPVRPEAKPAIERARNAGIAIIMITGDHPATALYIAKQLGMASGMSDVVSGSEFEAATQKERKRLALEKKVFARFTPVQKLEIVRTLQDAGNYVAVTGDGVNDAPALHRANIGIAMGSGTDVAKDSASIIITDDNIASVVSGVEQGRYAYDNVRKIVYQLTSTGLAEIVIIVGAVLAATPIPLTAVQLLWINLVTNGIQNVGLAFEGGEPESMKRKPRHVSEGVFNKLMLQEVAVTGLFIGIVATIAWHILLGMGYSEFAARNGILLLIVLFENMHVMNCRSEYVSIFRIPFNRNRLLVVGILVAQGVHIASMYIPFMQKVLDTQPVSLAEWLSFLGIALSIIVVSEIFKLVQKFRNAPTARIA